MIVNRVVDIVILIIASFSTILSYLLLNIILYQKTYNNFFNVCSIKSKSLNSKLYQKTYNKHLWLDKQ